MPLRIALVGPVFPYRGGISHYTALMANHLRARAHEVTVITFSRGYPRVLYPGRSDQDPSSAPVTTDAHRLIAPLDPRTWPSAAQFIAKTDPQLLVIQWWVPFWAPSLGTVARLVGHRSSAPVVFVCHNVLPHDGGTWLARAMTRYALEAGTGYVVHSDVEAIKLQTLISDSRVVNEPAETALRGASLAEGSSRHRRPRPIRKTMLAAHALAPVVPRADARQQLGFDTDTPILLFFGLVRAYKGLSRLVRALPGVRKVLPRTRLVVAGEFWEPIEAYRSLALQLGVGDAITWVDHYLSNEEAAVYFGAADVVVQPYLEATQSGVVATAVTFGRPSIVTRVGGLPEAVEDGVSGLVVPPDDPEALAGAIIRFFAEPGLQAALTAGASAAAETRFGWATVTEALESFA